MKQALNEISLQGILNEIDLNEKTTTDGRNYISGNVTLLVHQAVNEKPEDEYIKVSCFAFQRKTDGSENKAYERLYEVLHSGVSMAAVDGDESKADVYNLWGGSIRKNTFKSRDGNIVSYDTINGAFFRKAQNRDTYAKFSTEVFVTSIDEEIVDDEVTGRIVLNGAIVGYNDSAEAFKFIIEDKRAIDYVTSTYNTDDTVKISGICRATVKSITMPSLEEVGFGKADEVVRQRTVREFVVTAGSQGALEDGYEPEEVKKALIETKMRTESRLETKSNSGSSVSKAASRGF